MSSYHNPNYTYTPTAIAPPQALDLSCLGSPKNDDFLLDLGRYIAVGVNWQYQIECPNELGIRDVIDYDAVNIDVSRFPLLKLYRQTDTYESMSSGVTKAVIAYCLTYPIQDRLPGLLRWMSQAINILLDNYHHQHQSCKQNVILEERNTEYKIMVAEPTRAIYPFLRCNFSFWEQ